MYIVSFTNGARYILNTDGELEHLIKWLLSHDLIDNSVGKIEFVEVVNF